VRVARVELQPVQTALELATEARRMQSCVATWCEKLVQGGRWIFAGRILGAPATVEVRRLGTRYVIEQALGFRNQPLTDAQRRRLGTWLKAIDGRLASRAHRAARIERDEEAPSQLALPGLPDW
jgi:hypothetical protein